jgi:VanZ family protein
MNSDIKILLPRRRLFGSVLAVYWLGIFIATHSPGQPEILNQVSDKSLHWAAYCGLAILYSLWSSTRYKFSIGWVCRSFLILASYGIADELLQIPVNRHCDFLDWLADIGGILVGLCIPIFARKLFPKLWNRLTTVEDQNTVEKNSQQ